MGLPLFTQLWWKHRHYPSSVLYVLVALHCTNPCPGLRSACSGVGTGGQAISNPTLITVYITLETLIMQGWPAILLGAPTPGNTHRRWVTLKSSTAASLPTHDQHMESEVLSTACTLPATRAGYRQGRTRGMTNVMKHEGGLPCSRA